MRGKENCHFKFLEVQFQRNSSEQFMLIRRAFLLFMQVLKIVIKWVPHIPISLNDHHRVCWTAIRLDCDCLLLCLPRANPGDADQALTECTVALPVNGGTQVVRVAVATPCAMSGAPPDTPYAHS
jgi:hypothetical protein